jgi:hypothetical protein
VLEASLIAFISACDETSFCSITLLWPLPITVLFKTITAPIGTSFEE